MTLESQVSNKELSIKLRDLGVPQKSLFYWQERNIQKDKGFEKKWKLVQLGGIEKILTVNNAISAFTVAELGEMLPKGEYLETFFHSLEVQLTSSKEGMGIKGKNIVFQGDTEADARAKMLVYLLKNKLITL